MNLGSRTCAAGLYDSICSIGASFTRPPQPVGLKAPAIPSIGKTRIVVAAKYTIRLPEKDLVARIPAERLRPLPLRAVANAPLCFPSCLDPSLRAR